MEICAVKIPLSPCTILGCRRRASLGDSCLGEDIDIIHAKNRTPPPRRLNMQRQGKVDQCVPSLEGPELRLGTPIDQGEAELGGEGHGLWHRPDGQCRSGGAIGRRTGLCAHGIPLPLGDAPWLLTCKPPGEQEKQEGEAHGLASGGRACYHRARQETPNRTHCHWRAAAEVCNLPRTP